MIKDVFFDLDRTLWDFDRNSKEELVELWQKFELFYYGITLVDEFVNVYKQINSKYWRLYSKNLIGKDELRVVRFKDTFAYFGIDHLHFVSEFAELYVHNCPKRTNLLPGALTALSYLKKKYRLHIITNGFSESQDCKLTLSGLSPFFETVLTSDDAGFKKPSRQIFDLALMRSGSKSDQSIYIGDDLEVDVLGAVNAGWRSIYYNPNRNAHKSEPFAEISHLDQLKEIL